jgi:hypothetical protein
MRDLNLRQVTVRERDRRKTSIHIQRTGAAVAGPQARPAAASWARVRLPPLSLRAEGRRSHLPGPCPAGGVFSPTRSSRPEARKRNSERMACLRYPVAVSFRPRSKYRGYGLGTTLNSTMRIMRNSDQFLSRCIQGFLLEKRGVVLGRP